MTLVLVIILWVFAVGLILAGALRKTPVQVVQNRLDEFKSLEEATAPHTWPVGLLHVPGRAREPFLKAIISVLRRVGDPLTRSVPTLAKMDADLARAGHPYGLDAVEFLGIKGVTTALGLLVPLIFTAPLARLNPVAPLLLPIIAAMMGWIAPSLWLGRKIKQRTLDIKVALPDLLDLMILSMDAGIGFDGALGRAVDKTKGPLTEELRRVLNDINHGKSRAEAFRDLAARAKMEDLSLLLAAINQSEQLGTSIGTALRIQAHEIRRRRTQELREMAAKLPVKMLIPLIICIFPSLLLVILGPAAVMLMQSGVLAK